MSAEGRARPSACPDGIAGGFIPWHSPTLVDGRHRSKPRPAAIRLPQATPKELDAWDSAGVGMGSLAKSLPFSSSLKLSSEASSFARRFPSSRARSRAARAGMCRRFLGDSEPAGRASACLFCAPWSQSELDSLVARGCGAEVSVAAFLEWSRGDPRAIRAPPAPASLPCKARSV